MVSHAPHLTDKADNVEGSPPPGYSELHQSIEPGTDAARAPAGRTLERSGFADLGLGYDAAGTYPHGYANPAATDDAGETSMNRSLRLSPRRSNWQTDAAPLGYVNRSFAGDTGVSDQPSRGRSRSPDVVDTDQPTVSSHDPAPSHAQGQPRSRRRSNRSLEDPTPHPNIPLEDAADWPDRRSRGNAPRPIRKPEDSNADATIFPSGLPRDTGPESPSGRRRGDRAFEIVTPADDKPLTKDGREPAGHPGYDPAFDRHNPPSRPDPRSRVSGGVRSVENLAVPPPGGKDDRKRLNRSFDPSSYLPDATSFARQGSAPDVQQPTIHFNTEAQGIDV